MVDTLIQNPAIPHGTIAVAFTPDEEIGVGIEKFDVEDFGAEFTPELRAREDKLRAQISKGDSH